MKIRLNDLIGFFEASGKIGKAVDDLLQSIDPHDLLPALMNMTEAEKQCFLDYYQSKESYLHCHIIYRTMQAYLDDPVHDEYIE